MQTADVINQLAAFPSKRAHSEDVHEAARSEVLSKLPPLQVLNLFYSRKLSLQRPAVVTGIRSRFKTRKELLWESHLSVEEDEAHTVVKRADGTVLCRLRSEKALAFFHLPKREAISTVELWHHLRGLSAGLLVQDGDRCFEPIRKLQKEIAEQLASVRIDMPTIRRLESVAPTSEVPNVSLTPFDEVAEKASQVYELAMECHSLICQKEPDADWIKRSVVFRKPVNNTKSLKGWIDAADKMFNGTFSRLPTLGDDSKALASSVFQLLRILADRFDDRRFPVYELEKRYLGTARIQKPQIEQLDNGDALPIQRQILGSLAEVMNESVRHRRQMMHPDEWTKSLAANEFRLPLDEQLEAETSRFIELRDRAVWPDDGSRVFSDDVNIQVADHAGELAKSIVSGQWKRVWTKLFESGHKIISVTTDSGAAHSGQELLERFDAVLAKDKSDFAVVRHLRHRAAHGFSFKGLNADSKKRIHQEWLTTQNWVKRRLGRRWSWNEKTGARTVFFDEERDMRLTPLEGSEVKLALLVAVNRCLEKFRKVE